MQASGDVTTGGVTTPITMHGDISIVIKQVTGNVAYGAIIYSDVCSASATESPQCVSGDSRPVYLKIAGDTLSFETKSATGVDYLFVGNYAAGTISGTFTLTNSSGKIIGTFSVTHA